MRHQELFTTAQRFSSISFQTMLSFLQDISFKRKLLDKRNMRVLKIASVLFLLH